MAQTLVDCNMLSNEASENFLGEVSESRPKLEQEGEVTETDILNEDGIMADLAPKVEKCDLATMVENPDAYTAQGVRLGCKNFFQG